MTVISPNMGLIEWDSPNAYDHNELKQNWQAIDAHDHSNGNGVQITSGGIANGAIETQHLQDGAVTNPKVANNAIDTQNLVDNSVSQAKVQDLSISTAKLIDNAVTFPKINSSVWSVIHQVGLIANRPAAATRAGYIYLATDVNGGTSYLSDGTIWNQMGAGVNQQQIPLDGSVTVAKLDPNLQIPCFMINCPPPSAATTGAAPGPPTPVSIPPSSSSVPGIRDFDYIGTGNGELFIPPGQALLANFIFSVDSMASSSIDLAYAVGFGPIDRLTSYFFPGQPYPSKEYATNNSPYHGDMLAFSQIYKITVRASFWGPQSFVASIFYANTNTFGVLSGFYYGVKHNDSGLVGFSPSSPYMTYNIGPIGTLGPR